MNGPGPDVVMTLLLQVAQLEWRLKSLFEALLEAKDKSCEECKNQSVQRLMELSEFFSGEKALTRIQRDESLMKWFAATATEVRSIGSSLIPFMGGLALFYVPLRFYGLHCGRWVT